MVRSLEGNVCALCGLRGSTRDGEHVLPKWFLNRYLPVADGHYTTEVNGVAVLNRADNLKKHSWPEVRVPACEPCNTALRNRFEIGDTQAAAQKFFDTPAAPLSAAEAESAGVWLLKTWVLLAHPDAVFANGQSPDRWSRVPDVWGWTADGSPPPPQLSLWVTRQQIDIEATERLDVPYNGQARGRGIYERHVVALHGDLWEPADPLFTEPRSADADS